MDASSDLDRERTTLATLRKASKERGTFVRSHEYKAYRHDIYRRRDGTKYCPFLKRTPDGWEPRFTGPWELYKEDDLSADTILIPEGEGCVDTLRAMGFPSVTNPHGAGPGKWLSEFNERFRGKTVILLSDNNDVGRDFMDEVADELMPFATSVKVLDLAKHCKGLKRGGDVTNWVEDHGGGPDKLRSLLLLAGPPTGALDIVTGTDLAEEDLNWLWEGWIPEIGVTLYVGKQGTGKGFALACLIAAINLGILTPDKKHKFPVGKVLILSAEESATRTLKKKLKAAGAIESMWHVIRAGVIQSDGARHFDIARDLWRIVRWIRRNPDVALIVIDPVDAYADGTNPNKNDEVRKLMMMLHTATEEMGVPILGVRHFRKSAAESAIDKVMGASAWTQVARSVIFTDVEDGSRNPRRIFAVTKCNDCEKPPGLLATITNVVITYNHKQVNVGHWSFCDETMDVTTDEHYNSNLADQMSQPKFEQAKELIANELNKGPQKASDVRNLGAAQGLHEKMLERARGVVGGVTTKVGAFWWWHWPKDRDAIMTEQADELVKTQTQFDKAPPKDQTAAKLTAKKKKDAAFGEEF